MPVLRVCMLWTVQLNQPTAIVALSVQDSETKVLGFDYE